MGPVLALCEKVAGHLRILEPGLEVFPCCTTRHDGAPQTLFQTHRQLIENVYSAVSVSFRNAPAFLALADEALQPEHFRFERLDSNSGENLKSGAPTSRIADLANPCWAMLLDAMAHTSAERGCITHARWKPLVRWHLWGGE